MNKYYQNELEKLREQAAEFAQAYPTIAAKVASGRSLPRSICQSSLKILKSEPSTGSESWRYGTASSLPDPRELISSLSICISEESYEEW